MPSRFRPIPPYSLALLLSLLATIGACGLRPPPPPVDRSQDDRIQAEVIARLEAEPELHDAAIRVEVDGRTVMLHGSVKGMGAWQCAITNAALVPGVLTVVDYLLIERGARDVRCLAPRPDSSFIVGGP